MPNQHHDSYSLRRVSNGWILKPLDSPRMGEMIDPKDVLVFNTTALLYDYLISVEDHFND